ncbi:unnamed protein product [Acanthoscelides obtectus]|uniref:Uncharacterized protein n=1 Tax=Acanthoscelides obtectus TaxID=200917 RepID=A0A9P0JW32_ACAOB|nr:unnamed protein product [Acanthoscelides obtectus]CAK1647124.1 hypothetical protein AOBTE_LOCUS15057 [Acanthoscelides obtectus]
MPLRLWLHLNNSVVESGNSNFKVTEDILRNVRHLEQDFDNSGNIEQDVCITYSSQLCGSKDPKIHQCLI